MVGSWIIVFEIVNLAGRLFVCYFSCLCTGRHYLCGGDYVLKVASCINGPIAQLVRAHP